MRIVNFHKTLRAGALYYAIFIAFLIALVCTVILMGSYLHHTFVIRYVQSERMERNIRSAILLSHEDPKLVGLNETKEIALFDDDEDVVTIQKYPWGVFNLEKYVAVWKNEEKERIFLTGNDMKENKPVALYLADQQRYLSVSGHSRLRGNCFLPALGIRRAYIEGKSFMGVTLVEGKTEKSNAVLPEINLQQVTTEMQLIQRNFAPGDSVFSAEAFASKPAIKRSFYETTMVLYSENWIYLQGQSLSGNIKIVSGKGISVDRTTILNEVILYAPQVYVGNEFNGSVQVFANDTILVGKKCTFLSPSALVMLSEIENPLIDIGSETLIKGDILQSAKGSDTRFKPMVKIDTKSRIEGQVYVNGKIDLRGTIYGSLYCMGFVLQTPGALYENHMLDAVIDYPALSAYYSGFVVFPVGSKTKTLKQME